MRVHPIELTAAQGRFSIPADAEPADVVLDPEMWILMERAALVASR